jgi:hypothetical protein
MEKQRTELLQQLRDLDPSRLPMVEKLIRCELIGECLDPNDPENEIFAHDVINQLLDDCADDPAYHGYDREQMIEFLDWIK